MSIKTKIRSLIAAANAKTGKGDTDLTTAVQSLISKTGGITPSGNKALTPSETAQTGIDVTNFATVSVDAIPSTHVGSGVTRKAAATVAPSTSEQTVCMSGVYTTGVQTVSAITPNIVGDLNASRFVASIVAALAGKGVAVPAGTKLSGLAALIESIQTSGGSVDQISFSLQISQGGQISDYGTFTATSGTTWADWIGSSYTFDDGLVLIIDGNGHVVNSEGIYELQYNGATVNGSDQIISGATYTLFNIYG